MPGVSNIRILNTAYCMLNIVQRVKTENLCETTGISYWHGVAIVVTDVGKSSTVKQRGLTTVRLLWSQAQETVPIWQTESTRVNYRQVIVITGTENRFHLTQWNNEG